MSGRKFHLSSGEQRWNYLHGADIGRALVSVIDEIDFSGDLNIANPESVAIKEIATQIETILNLRGFISFAQDQNSKVPNVLPDSKRLHQLGWKPSIGLDSGLELTAQWIRGETQTLQEYGFQNLKMKLFSKLNLDS
jgi:nucleoside-diphosphate-sugar epimerase